ncbi:DUF421 domain-containing protein [Azohydromonas caseinilytica]|uniref:DUF421 domain-containing protein n=1 Tax=Azohydromonas caseinilytica TaxID=2728836 RepID=A0A848F8Q7_9BURK|nr:YetF domain-containing protein [Azohydromonas caseinilytica]NML15742.1 DUF421 domain-containing protein [Azohydromonas caseinilytica]
MDLFLRTVAVYIFLLIILRLAGKRTLSEMSTFDFILVLIISEATQNALVDDDRSLTNGLAVILTLVALDRLAAVVKRRSQRVEQILEGTPLMLVDHGRVLEERMKKSNVTLEDILQSARLHQGIARLDQIKYAVLEASGGISIIPVDENAELDQRIEAAVTRALARHNETVASPR